MSEKLKRIAPWVLLGQAILDIVLINLAFLIAYLGRYEFQWFRPVDEFNFIPYREYLPVSLILTVILIIVYRVEGLYHPRRGASWLDDLYTIAIGTAVGMAVIIVLFYGLRPNFYSRLLFAYASIAIVAFLSLSRLTIRQVRDHLRARGMGVDRVLIVGAGEMGRAITRGIIALPQLGYQVIGFLDDKAERRRNPIGRFSALGETRDLPRILGEQPVDEVIITLPWTDHQRILEMVQHCNAKGVRTRIVPDLFLMGLSRVDIDEIGGIPLLGFREAPLRGWNLTAKRIVDLFLSTTLLILLAPLMLLIAALIVIDSPGPVLFRQTRVGRGGVAFTLYKFRSMRKGAEAEAARLAQVNQVDGAMFKLRDDPRRTRLGRFLRRISLDELPQLYNVLRGQMSLVGPRPPVPTEVEHYQPWHRKRLELQPGLTGLWQVMGRSDLSFEEMVMLDLFYAENWSLWLDLKILLMTIPSVLAGKGAY